MKTIFNILKLITFLIVSINNVQLYSQKIETRVDTFNLNTSEYLKENTSCKPIKEGKARIVYPEFTISRDSFELNKEGSISLDLGEPRN